jgi:predicted regulator of Ras-like GTPase activity (Roadblock/LC7/MglB family)
MKSSFEDVLGLMTHQRGVVGCLVVGEEDGLVIDANVQVGIHESAIAALGAALYRKARLASAAAGLGEALFLRLDADRGHLCVAGHGELLLVTVAEPRANIGLIRAAMLRSLGALV